MFKSLVFSFVFFATVFCENPTDMSEKSLMTLMFKMFEHATPCAQEYNLTEEDIHTFKQVQFPEGEHNKCFVQCTFTSLTMMKDGKYTPVPASENVKKVLGDNKDAKLLEQLLMSCESVNDMEVSDGDKSCDLARYVFECLKTNAPNFGLRFTGN